MRRRASPLLLAALAFSACGQSGPWTDALETNRLFQRANALKVQGACAARVPLEYDHTVPIPTDRKSRAFEILYYVQTPERYATKRSVSAPKFAAVFSMDSSANDRCMDIPSALPANLGQAASPPFFKAAYARDLFETYEGLDRAADFYFKGEALNPEERNELQKLSKAFVATAEPALIPSYYRVNPDFWEWLRTGCGRSIPKPAGN